MSEFRPRGRGRGRGGPPRGGGFRGRGGSMMDRDSGPGSFRGRGYSRGRGGPSRSRDDLSPPRKTPLLSRSYDSSDRGRRHDRYDDSYSRGPPHRSRDLYSSPSRDSGRNFDRYSSSYKDSYSNGSRDDRHDSFSRSMRDYPPSRGGDYERSRDFHDSPREYGSSRDYPSSRGSSYREPLGSREFRGPSRSERSYSGRGRGSSRFDDRGPPRDFGGRGRGGRGRDDRGRSFMGGSRGRGGPPRGRGRPEFSGGRSSDRRSPPSSRDGAGGKRPRMESSEGYRR